MSRYSDDILDLRYVANDWRELLNDDGKPEGPEAIMEVREFERLCERLGCDATPEALEKWGNDFSPTLIAEGYFVQYARDLAEEVGCYGLTEGSSWPLNCIDWERAAVELAWDYESVSLFGFDYLIRL